MVAFTVNGRRASAEAPPGTPLLWVLREHLGLTGTKYGCGAGLCGACTVHLDGRPARSCIARMRSLGDRKVTTIEGISGPIAAAVQESWDELQVPQCGYCQSGQVMAALALLEGDRRPSDADVDEALTGNVCRCATYVRIRRAVHAAAARLGNGAGAGGGRR